MFSFTLPSKTNNRVSDDSYCNDTLCLCSGLFSSPPTWNKCLATPIHGRPASWPKWQASPKPEKNTYKISTSQVEFDENLVNMSGKYCITLQWRHNERDGVSIHQPHNCLPNRLFRHRSEKISKLRVTGLCAGNSPVTGEFLAQRASNAENISINVSIWWRHHVSSRMTQWVSNNKHVIPESRVRILDVPVSE